MLLRLNKRLLGGLLTSLAAMFSFGVGVAHSAQEYPRFSYLLDTDGSGLLYTYADIGPDWAAPNPAPALERCLPGEACVPVAPESWPGSMSSTRLSVEGDPVGTTYRATADGQVVVSEPWQGPLANTSLPIVTGPVAVGAQPQPVAGTWAGGWGFAEEDYLSLEACETAGGARCESLPDSCAIPSKYEGRWLAVVDWRSSPVLTAVGGLLFDHLVPAYAPTRNRARNVVGQIAAGPKTRDCRSPRGEWMPFARLKRMKYAGSASKLVGGVPRRVGARGRRSVRLFRGVCVPSCSAEVRVSRGKRLAISEVTLGPSSKTVTFSSRVLREVARRSGRTVTVTLRAGDSDPIAKRVRVDF